MFFPGELHRLPIHQRCLMVELHLHPEEEVLLVEEVPHLEQEGLPLEEEDP